MIQNTVGNIFSGQVVGDTAETLSKRFGKILQRRKSISFSQGSTTLSTNTQMDSLIPPSKISNLSQGMFVGAVADNFDERIEQKIFHAQIVVDNERIKRETDTYTPIPEISSFMGADGQDHMKEIIQANYERIRADVERIVKTEMKRIEDDPELRKLIPKPKQQAAK